MPQTLPGVGPVIAPETGDVQRFPDDRREGDLGDTRVCILYPSAETRKLAVGQADLGWETAQTARACATGARDTTAVAGSSQEPAIE